MKAPSELIKLFFGQEEKSSPHLQGFLLPLHLAYLGLQLQDGPLVGGPHLGHLVLAEMDLAPKLLLLGQGHVQAGQLRVHFGPLG